MSYAQPQVYIQCTFDGGRRGHGGYSALLSFSRTFAPILLFVLSFVLPIHCVSQKHCTACTARRVLLLFFFF